MKIIWDLMVVLTQLWTVWGSIEEMVLCYQNCSDLLWEKKCFSDREKRLKFEAEGQEFAKFLRSLEQFIQTVHCSERSEQFLVTECFFNLFLEVSHI
jgi:hypothetical protein